MEKTTLKMINRGKPPRGTASFLRKMGMRLTFRIMIDPFLELLTGWAAGPFPDDPSDAPEHPVEEPDEARVVQFKDE
jgi:hypothetical protein